MRTSIDDDVDNWGRWARAWHEQLGFPALAPMFENAPMSKWHEDGWGEKDANGERMDSAPAEIPTPIDEIRAEKTDKIVNQLPRRHILALKIHYGLAPASIRNKRYKQDDLYEEAKRLIADIGYVPPFNVKAYIINALTAKEKKSAWIAKVCRVSKQYVGKIAREIGATKSSGSAKTSTQHR